ncbi:hypothetical protein WJX64_14565 [Leifsonia sp. YIM 134122]|uniref:Sortase n=1 Tax=Leifsonia stereocauli TaxID=3134136 RepID=A0ABU9W6Z3_9MICO
MAPARVHGRLARIVGVVVIGGAMLVGIASGAASGAVADDGGGIDLSFTVPAASGVPGGSFGNGPAVIRPATAAVTPSAQPVKPTAEEFDLGGIVYVGGLTTNYVPSLNPTAGAVELSLPVRNVSETTFDSTATFWIEGPFGNRLGSIGAVEIADLKPGELRVISAEVPGTGQWALVNTHVTFTPPKSVEDTALTPVTRDSFVFATPWHVLVGLLVGIGAVFAVRAGRSLLSARLVGEAA